MGESDASIKVEESALFIVPSGVRVILSFGNCAEGGVKASSDDGDRKDQQSRFVS